MLSLLQMESLSRSQQMYHRITQRMSRIAKRNRATKIALVTGATRDCMALPRGCREVLKEGQRREQCRLPLAPMERHREWRTFLWASIPGAPARFGPRVCLV